MKTALRYALALLLAIPIILFYLLLLQTLWGSCEQAADLELCHFGRNTHIVFYTLITLSFLMFPVAIALRFSMWKWLTLSLLGAMSFYAGLTNFSAYISDVRIYSYEPFFALASYYLPLLILLFTASLLFIGKRRLLIILSAVAAVCFIIAAALTGRGTTWHYSLLLGLPVDNLLLWQHNTLVQLGLVFLAIATVYYLLHGVISWVKTGFWQAPLKHPLFVFILFSLLLASSLLSLPLGSALHQRDISAAQAYLEGLSPKLEEYRKQHAEYPMSIAEIIEKDTLPRLLARHDEILFGGKGNFYLSRPDFYCVVFHDPSSNYGYFSKTVDRDWRYSHKGQSFAQHFAAMCDAEKPTQNLIAGHLGLEGTDDPLAGIHYMLGESVRPAVTPKASGELQDLLEGMRDQYPELFERPSKESMEDKLKSNLSIPLEDIMKQAIETAPVDNVDRRQELEETLRKLQQLQEELQ